MLLLRWIWTGNGSDGEVTPVVVFWTLRVLMFMLSFVLEDWALHELLPSSRHRRVAVLLVASSYVTWTYQTHTFSNSIETLLVAWSLVLIHRIVEDTVRNCAPDLDRLLTVDAAADIASCVKHTGLLIRFWNFQSDYLPGFLIHTWSSFDTAFSQKVCLCPTVKSHS
jgi:hypothetical protein